MDTSKSTETLRKALMDIVSLTDALQSNDPVIKTVHEKARAALLEFTTTEISGTGNYKHNKRGTVYSIESIIEIQASTGPLLEGDLAVVYRSLSSRLAYGRKLIEFNDGRFDRI